MLTYSLDNIGSESLYLYLYRCIKNDIQDGTLSSGEQLPSKRSFARHLGISNITVENTYALLQSEGYIYSIPKTGFFVSDLSMLPEKPNSNMHGRFLSNNMPVPPGVQEKKFFADFASNYAAPESFPFSVWAKLMRETISIKQNELVQNPPCGGVMELRLAICEHLRQFRGMEISPEQVIIGAGTEYLYNLLVNLLGREKIYAVETPGYRKISKIYQINGACCKFIDMDSCGIRIDKLLSLKADIAHISPSHHYPSGIVMPASRRYELLSWAAENKNRYIIEDDYDSEFRFAAKPMPTLQSIDQTEKVIYINTFTKSLASTIRISYMVLPRNLLRRFFSKFSFFSGTVSNFEQYTLAKFIHEGYFEKHINRMRNYYRSIRDRLLNEIAASSLAAHSTITEETAGLHFILELDTRLPDKILVQKAAENGIHISCLSEYYHTTLGAPKHTIVMNYSGISKDKIPEAIKRLADAVGYK